MFGALAKQLFGSANDRYLKGLRPTVAAMNALEPQLQELSHHKPTLRIQISLPHKGV